LIRFCKLREKQGDHNDHRGDKTRMYADEWMQEI
jgi:hypothetical protein